jgi:hypothetical protein
MNIERLSDVELAKLRLEVETARIAAKEIRLKTVGK